MSMMMKQRNKEEVWENLKAQRMVYGFGWDAPTLKPDPKTWVKPYMRNFVIQERESLAVIQLAMFSDKDGEKSEEIPEEGVFNCSLGSFKVHKTVESFNEVIEQYKKDGKFVALDIETDGINPHVNRIRAIQVCNDGKFSHVLLCERLGNACREPLINLLENCPVVLQNGTFDIAFLLVFTGVFPANYIFDTLLAAQDVDAGLFESRDKAFNLGSLVYRYLNIKIDKSKQKDFATLARLPLDMESLRYAANDTIATWRLAPILALKLEEKGLMKTFRELDLPCMGVSVDIKVRGVPVDIEHILTLLGSSQIKIDALTEVLNNQLGSNLTSEDIEDGEDVFTGELDLELVMETLSPKSDKNIKSTPKLLKAFHNLGFKDLTSTSEGAIGSYFLKKVVRAVKPNEVDKIKEVCPAAGTLLEWRELSKGLGYLKALGQEYDPKLKDTENKKRFYNAKTGCVHPNLHVCGSLAEAGTAGAGAGKDIATGRFSCSSPNLQNIPALQSYRDMFKAPPGWLIIKSDASQQEVRVMAEVSGDEALRAIYINAGINPVDIYSETAAAVLGKSVASVTKSERAIFKAIVLAIGYGAAAPTISASAGISMDEADKAIKAYFKKFQGVKKFIDSCESQAKTKGFLQNQFSGRRRHWNHERLRGFEFKYRTQAANFLIQGGSADCSKKALLLAYEQLAELGCRPLPPVHDELVYMAPMVVAQQAQDILDKCMVDGSEYFMKKVPMRSEGASGKTWRKEAGYCYCCNLENKEPDNVKKGEFHYRLNFEEITIRKWGDEYLPICGRCVINERERSIHGILSVAQS